MTPILLMELCMMVIIFGLWMLSVNDGPGKPFLIAWGLIVIVFVFWEYTAYGRIPIFGKETVLDSCGVTEILRLFLHGIYEAYQSIVSSVVSWIKE